jgi:hypothetical protein
MDGGLGFAQPGKQLLCAILASMAQRGPVDQTVDVVERPVHLEMLFLMRLSVDVTMALVMMAMIVPVVAAVAMVRTMVVVTTIVVRVVQRAVLALDAELGGRDSGARDPLGPDRGRCNREGAERRADVLEFHASVDQRAEDHVSSRTGEAVEVQDLHNLSIVPAYPDLRG